MLLVAIYKPLHFFFHITCWLLWYNILSIIVSYFLEVFSIHFEVFCKRLPCPSTLRSLVKTFLAYLETVEASD